MNFSVVAADRSLHKCSCTVESLRRIGRCMARRLWFSDIADRPVGETWYHFIPYSRRNAGYVIDVSNDLINDTYFEWFCVI